MGGNRGLTHGCKGVPEILLVNNAISVLVNYSKSLWRVGMGTGEVRNGPKASALLPQADQILALSQLTPPPPFTRRGGILNLPPPLNRCTFGGGGGGLSLASLTHLLELLDLSLVEHGEDIGAPFCCCPSLGLLGCL